MVVIRVISTQGCAIKGAGGLRIKEKCELYVEWQGVQIGVVGEVVSRDAEGGLGLKFLGYPATTASCLPASRSTAQGGTGAVPLSRSPSWAVVSKVQSCRRLARNVR
jgi:hypothetical protein